MKIQRSLIIISSVVVLSGCAGMGPKQTGGTLIGAAGGALIGSQFGGGSGQLIGTAIGATAGAIGGGYVGKQLDDDDNKK